MSKEFDNWWKENCKLYINLNEDVNESKKRYKLAIAAWLGCKREVLNILNQQSIENMGEIEVAILLDKIEKL